MKANELMIGNYVKSTLGLVDTFMIYKSDLHIMTEEGRDMSIYEPIPLTEEWLLKLGFEKDFLEWDKQCISLQYWKQSNSYHWVSSSGDIDVLLKHVHQLQNLYFALKNEELNVR